MKSWMILVRELKMTLKVGSYRRFGGLTGWRWKALAKSVIDGYDASINQKGCMEIICKDCGTAGKPEAITNGSMGIEIILWLCFLVPGLIYSIWRLSSRHDGCAVCHGRNIVPVGSPLGRQLVASIPGATKQIETERKPSPIAVQFGRSLGRLFVKK